MIRILEGDVIDTTLWDDDINNVIKQAEDIMAQKGVPKRDGSGKGVRANRGRCGCAATRKTGKGRNRRK